MTLGDVANKVRELTHTDTVSYPAANLLININIWYQKAISMILESQDDTDFDDRRNTNYPVVTTPMIANQRDYPIPVSEKVLKVKRVDLTYNGSDWFKAEAFDTGSFPFGIGFDSATSTDTGFDQNFIQQAPRYDVAYNSLWIAPMPLAADVTNGGMIRVEWEREITAFTTSDYTTDPNDSTVVLGFDTPFHPIVAWGAAFEKALADNLPQLPMLVQGLADWETRLRQAYYRKDLDDRLFLKADYQTYR